LPRWLSVQFGDAIAQEKSLFLAGLL
jgi:hypothetical protein